jgi:hypothetical protein
MPAATVILNSYNQAAFVGEAIESVLVQSEPDLELVVIDNGSTDDSQTIIERFAATDARIRPCLHSDNVAITRRFNEGVAAARSPYVSFLYSDDVLVGDKLERQLDLFGRLPDDYGVVYAPATGWNTRTDRRWTYGSIGASGWIFDDILARHFAGQIDMVSPLTRIECLEQHPFYEDVFAEGEGVFFRIALTHQFQFDPTPVAVLRDHGGNAGKAVRRNAEMTMVTLDRLAAHPALPNDGVAKVRRFRARLLRSYAWQAARLGEHSVWVWRCLAEAVRLDPALVMSPRALGAGALSVLPASLRARLNRAGTAIRGGPGNDVLVQGFGEGG